MRVQVPLWVFLLVLCSRVGFAWKKRVPFAASVARTERLQQRLADIREKSVHGTILCIDGDNVRGKSNFGFSKEELLEQIWVWAGRNDWLGSVVLHYDHGEKHTAYMVRGLGVVFAGTARKADDVIARDVRWLQEAGRDVIVVTADEGLAGRCRTSARRADVPNLEDGSGDVTGRSRMRPKLSIVQSEGFAELLMNLSPRFNVSTGLSSDEGSPTRSILGLYDLDEESRQAVAVADGDNINVGESLSDNKDRDAVDEAKHDNVEKQATHVAKELNLRRGVIKLKKELNRGSGKKKSLKLRRRLRDLESRLAASIAVSQSDADGGVGRLEILEGIIDPTTTTDQRDDSVVKRILKLGSGRRGREQTWERIILAERLRNQLQQLYPEGCENSGENSTREIASSQHTELLELYVGGVATNYSSEVTQTMSFVNAAGQGRRTLRSPAGPVSRLEVCISRDPAKPKWPGGLEDPAGKSSMRLLEAATVDGVPYYQVGQPFSLTVGENGSPNATSLFVVDEKRTPNTNPGVLAVVLISDTHGYHTSLDTRIPPADVLLHCGDFSLDSGRRKKDRDAQTSFDRWLADQPHPIKLVVRGNHDSMGWKFPQSRASYFLRNEVVAIRKGGVDVLLYASPHGGYRTAQVPENCDVFATHAPPSGILDLTYNRQTAGSSALRSLTSEWMPSSTEGAKTDAPKVWVFGHIHESSGATIVDFASATAASKSSESPPNSPGEDQPVTGTTLLLNAANANEGRARYLVRPPMMFSFDLRRSRDDQETEIPSTLAKPFEASSLFYESVRPMKGSESSVAAGHCDSSSTMSEPLNRAEVAHQGALVFETERVDVNSSDTKVCDEDKNTQRSPQFLLAVDLGINAGFAVFDEQGMLQSFGEVQGSSVNSVCEEILAAVASAQKTSMAAAPDRPIPEVTTVYLEGDKGLCDRMEAELAELKAQLSPMYAEDYSYLPLSSEITVKCVHPDIWRQDILIHRERSSSNRAKAAARVAARQVIETFSTTPRPDRMDTNAAEAILIGFWGTRKLAWTASKRHSRWGSLIARYTNGEVILKK